MNKNLNFINVICLKPPPIDNILPHLFYTNLKTIAHNKIVYDKMMGQIIKFVAQDVQFQTCPFHFKFPILPIHTTSLHHELLFLKNELIKMCLKLCNIRWSCKDCTFQVYTIFFPKLLIWIYKFPQSTIWN
jgi:hypothetical protein